MIFEPTTCFAQNCAPILCRDKHYLQIDWKKVPFGPRHLGDPSGVLQTIYEPWYVRPIQCTYLVPRLTLSPNRPKWASTWPTSPRSSIGCAQNDFWAYRMFSANCAKRSSIWPTSLRRSIGCGQKKFHAYGTFSANRAHILAEINTFSM
jgi:hypothetical protein